MNEQHSFHASLERRKITPSDSDRASTEGITKETTKDDIKTGNALVKDNIEPPEKRDKEGLSTGVFDGMKLLNKKNDTVTLYKKMSDFTSTGWYNVYLIIIFYSFKFKSNTSIFL